jgi:radical SAM superfamily enzyme YgiQ (UPF0313 family)
MLLYPPGRLLQRSEDRAQCNISESAAGSVHACNDLGYCAAVLLQKGYDVFLRDYQTEGATLADVLADLRAFRPDMIAISTTNTSVKDDLAFINTVHDVCSCPVVMKGAIFYDIAPEKLGELDLENVSCLIGCEMEFVIGALADRYVRGEGDLAGVNGILYREGGGFVKNPFVCGKNDLNGLPFPARQLMNNAVYVRPDTGEPMATVQTGLGCPSGCIYCLTPVISGRNVRKRDVESVYKELEECYYKYHIKNFFFKADTFTIDEAYAGAVCDRIIRSPLHGKIAFTVNSRAKPLSAPLLQKLKDAGCFMIAVGFESGSEETMQKIKKGVTVADNERAARMIKDAGIPLFGFFMIGFPWETKSHIADTERLIRKIAPDFIEVHIATPFYGTELYDICAKEDLLADSVFGGDAYHPADLGTAYLGVEEVKRLKKKILLRFYLRPRYIAKKMGAAALHPAVAVNYVKYGMRMLSNLRK